MRVRIMALAVAVATASPQVAAASCEALSQLKLDKVTILSADAVPEGEFRIPPTYGPPPAPVTLPAHCRVRAVATPVKGSRIGFELWLPARGWNGRFKMYGNGGYSSALPYGQLVGGLTSGYAVTATDTGHQGDDPDFAIGLPESIIDWGHRAVHTTATHAKALTRAYYGRPADYSYFEGCSTGGHQALMSAQRYPDDFDGIIAGAPGHNRTRLNIGFLWQFTANRLPGSDIPLLTQGDLPLLSQAALDQCGSEAERAQGYLNDPFTCRVDVTRLQCQPGQSKNCLSADQVRAAQRMYDGARNPRTGAQIYPPWLPGSERGWASYWADPRNPKQPARVNFFRFWGFNNALWKWLSFDFDRDLEQLDRTIAPKIDATNPDLSRFAKRGGKLILYHGLADPVVSPWDTRNYYDAVQAHAGGDAMSFARLYFAPGMGHCGGGPGPNIITPQDTLENWVEAATPPAGLPISRADEDTQEKALCAYPAIGGNCRRPD